MYHQGLSYIPEIIKIELISRHYDDPLANYFGIEKTQEVVARKYYWETLCYDVKVYVKDCDIYLVSKTVRHKSYGNLQQLPVPIHHYKDLSIDFVMGLPQSADWRGNGYDLILLIVDWLMKMVYYELVQTTIIVLALAEVILNVVVRYYGLLNSIVSNCSSVFTSKFWSSMCYFLSIKQRLSTAFHLQTDGQTERQNSTIEVYLRAFINYE